MWMVTRELVQDTSMWPAEQVLPIDHGGAKETDDLSGKVDSSVSTSGPWDRGVGGILGLGNEDNIWDLHISATMGRTKRI